MAAARRAGLTTIVAEVRSGDRLDALRYGLMANKHHGLRRAGADKRHAVKLALREFGDLSDRGLAQLCGVGNQLVGHVRAELLCESHSLPGPRLGLDGKRRRPGAKSGPPSSSGSPETVGAGETADQAPAANPGENNLPVLGFTPGGPPATDDRKEGRDGGAGVPFTLAAGGGFPSGVLTRGWIEPGWILGRLGKRKPDPAVETVAQRQGCACPQRILMGLADALNRQGGSASSPEDLHHVENALTDLRNYTGPIVTTKALGAETRLASGVRECHSEPVWK